MISFLFKAACFLCLWYFSTHFAMPDTEKIQSCSSTGSELDLSVQPTNIVQWSSSPPVPRLSEVFSLKPRFNLCLPAVKNFFTTGLKNLTNRDDFLSVSAWSALFFFFLHSRLPKGCLLPLFPVILYFWNACRSLHGIHIRLKRIRERKMNL